MPLRSCVLNAEQALTLGLYCCLHALMFFEKEARAEARAAARAIQAVRKAQELAELAQLEDSLEAHLAAELAPPASVWLLALALGDPAGLRGLNVHTARGAAMAAMEAGAGPLLFGLGQLQGSSCMFYRTRTL